MRIQRSTSWRRAPIALLVAWALAFPGCSQQTTRQAPAVRPSGFLGDYTRLHPGAEGEAKLVYRAPDADFSRYDKVIVDRVAVWGAARSGDRPADELERLADILHSSLLAHLETYYVIAKAPGPGVMRVRAALTEAEPSSVFLDILSNVGPITGTVSAAKKMATGTHAFVGAAGVEAEVLDAETGKTLFAAVDRRVGEKTLTGATDEWSDVKDAFQVWVDRFVDRLQAEGGPRKPLPYWAQPSR